MLYQFFLILTSTRQPTPVVVSTDTAQFCRAVLAHMINLNLTVPPASAPTASRAVAISSQRPRALAAWNVAPAQLLTCHPSTITRSLQQVITSPDFWALVRESILCVRAKPPD